MRISDWSSDVCSSDLLVDLHDDIGAKLTTLVHALEKPEHADLVRAVVQDFRDIVSRTQQDACTLLEALAQMREETEQRLDEIGRASGRARVCQDVSSSVVAVSLKKKKHTK